MGWVHWNWGWDRGGAVCGFQGCRGHWLDSLPLRVCLDLMEYIFIFRTWFKTVGKELRTGVPPPLHGWQSMGRYRHCRQWQGHWRKKLHSHSIIQLNSLPGPITRVASSVRSGRFQNLFQYPLRWQPSARKLLSRSRFWSAEKLEMFHRKNNY